jgi:putative oxidoreductase
MVSRGFSLPSSIAMVSLLVLLLVPALKPALAVDFLPAMTMSRNIANAQAAPVQRSTGGGMSLSELAEVTGRVLLAQLFVISGVRKIANFSGTAAYMASYGLPFSEVLLVPTIALEVGGGLMLATGWHSGLAAGALAAFTLPTTFIFHRFWAYPTALEAMQQQALFLKNLAILGGLLSVLAQDDGPPDVLQPAPK